MSEQEKQEKDYAEMREQGLQEFGAFCAEAQLEYGLDYDSTKHRLLAMFEVFELTGAPTIHEAAESFSNALLEALAAESVVLEAQNEHARDMEI